MDSRQTEDRAAEWLAGKDSARWSDADERALGEWLRADTANRVAFLRLEAGWEKSARLKTFGVSARTGAVPAEQWRASPFFERRQGTASRPAVKAFWPKRVAMAAGVLLAVSGAIYLAVFFSADRYQTPVGGLAAIPLQDGSKVTLNTASRIRVVLTGNERTVSLEAGEAFFEVARDGRRPFVVQAGDRRVVVVGTQFSVRRDGAALRVIVTEGQVRLEDGAGGRGGLLAAGAVAHIDGDTVRVIESTPQEAELALSWRQGYLVFDDVTLADAVAEFNRYGERRMVIDDAALADLRISGKFRSTNAGDFILLLKNGFRIHARERGDTVRLSGD